MFANCIQFGNYTVYLFMFQGNILIMFYYLTFLKSSSC